MDLNGVFKLYNLYCTTKEASWLSRDLHPSLGSMWPGKNCQKSFSLRWIDVEVSWNGGTQRSGCQLELFGHKRDWFPESIHHHLWETRSLVVKSLYIIYPDIYHGCTMYIYIYHTYIQHISMKRISIYVLYIYIFNLVGGFKPLGKKNLDSLQVNNCSLAH